MYQSIEIATGIRIGNVGQPNILVPLNLCAKDFVAAKKLNYGKN